MKYQIHPLAALIPEMQTEEFKALCDSIERDGIREPIVLLAGKILDGRHRAKAADLLRINPPARVYDPTRDGPNVINFVRDKNLNRRHLSPGQRAMVAAAFLAAQQEAAEMDIAPKTPAQKQDDDDLKIEPKGKFPEEAFDPSSPESEATEEPEAPKPTTQQEAADALGVSRRSVQTAAKLLETAPDEAAKVQAGKASLNAAAQEAAAKAAKEKLQAERQKILKRIRANAGKDFAKAVDGGTLLKTVKELAAFDALTDEDQAKVAPLVATGWTVKKAFKHVTEAVGLDTTIRELIHRAIATKEAEYTVTVEGWEIDMTRVG